MNDFSVFVNSTDSYNDCWHPFFKLFSKNWPEYDGKIYLNTETKEFSYPGLEIVPTKVGRFKDPQSLTWSECLLYAFDIIESEILLYVQEDYFLKNRVNHAKILELADLMKKNNLAYVGLSNTGNRGPFHETVYPDLWKVDPNDLYKISTQASLWNKNRLRKYVRKHENPWQFEYYGNIRARRKKEDFFTLNRDIYGKQHEIFPYDATGIVNKKWKKEIVCDLFKENDITIDYSERGFYSNDHKPRPKSKNLSVAKVVRIIKSLI